MSKTIGPLKWYNGWEICRLVCNELANSGMAVVNWVDLSDKEGRDRRENREYNLQLVFTIVRAQRDGKFVNIVQMIGIPQDGRNGKVVDFVDVPVDEQGLDYMVTEEDIAMLIHNVVDDDSEPQYCLGQDVSSLGELKLDFNEPGWMISEGGGDVPVESYDRTEWASLDKNGMPHSDPEHPFRRHAREVIERKLEGLDFDEMTRVVDFISDMERNHR